MNHFPTKRIFYRAFLLSTWISFLYLPLVIDINGHIRTVRWVFFGRIGSIEMPHVPETITSISYEIFAPYWAVEFLACFAVALGVLVIIWQLQQRQAAA